ncbi:hypothetical protein [Streptomyces sp. NPDC003832]
MNKSVRNRPGGEPAKRRTGGEPAGQRRDDRHTEPPGPVKRADIPPDPGPGPGQREEGDA